MSDGKILPTDLKGVIDLAMAAGITGCVGAAETARALRGVIGDEAVKNIERAMVSALDRMDVPADVAASLHHEIRDIFARDG
jgi:hypothetical protein